VIRSIKHKGLKALYGGKTTRHAAPDHVSRLRDILAVLDHSARPGDLDLPGFGLHPLKGDRRGCWAVKVSGNWRVVFRFEESDVVDVDYVDYH
jgi:proteic killer suppression protein